MKLQNFNYFFKVFKLILFYSRNNNGLNNRGNNNNSFNKNSADYGYNKVPQNRQQLPRTHIENRSNVNQNPTATKGFKRVREEEPMEIGLIQRIQTTINIACNNPPDSNLLQINCKLNGQSSTGIIDTGAVCSCIAESECRKLKIPFKPSRRSIKVADGTVFPVKGETEELKIKINNSVSYIKFLVIPTNHLTMILGLDWQNHVGAIIHVKKKYIVIDNNIIPNSLEVDYK